MVAPRQSLRIVVAIRSVIVVAVVAFSAVFVSLAAVDAVRDAVKLTGSALVVTGPPDEEAEFVGYQESPPQPRETPAPACDSECSPLSLSFVSQWPIFQIPGWAGF